MAALKDKDKDTLKDVTSATAAKSAHGANKKIFADIRSTSIDDKEMKALLDDLGGFEISDRTVKTSGRVGVIVTKADKERTIYTVKERAGYKIFDFNNPRPKK